MSKIKEAYVPLDNATIISRRHQREVDPPGMVNIENAIPARSDASITMRPDMLENTTEIYGISSLLTVPSTAGLRDAVNSASGLYGSSQVMYFTTYIPWGSDNGTLKILSDTHTSGTVSGVAGESQLLGVDTDFQEKAYRGAIVKIPVVGSATGTAYTGSPHFWVESTTTGEWYCAEADTTELAIVGYQTSIFTDKTSGSGQYYIPNAVASLEPSQAGIDDGDSLGYEALYVHLADSLSPGTKVSDSALFAGVNFGINISGSNYKWTVSPAQAGEYYLTTKAGAVPPLVLTSVDSDNYVPGYTGSNNIKYYAPVAAGTDQHLGETFASREPYVTSADGVLGSLAGYEWGVGDNDSLGFSTYYVRDAIGDPDAVRSTRSLQSAKVKGELAITGGGATYSWTVTTSALMNNATDVFYLKGAGGTDPGFTKRPQVVILDGGTAYQVTNPAGLRDPRRWYYGDLDSLGYNTIYINGGKGDPDLSGQPIVAVLDHSLYGSNYAWTASANGGTNEYYLVQQDGTKLGAAMIEPSYVTVGSFYKTTGNSSQGTLESLANGEWAFGKDADDAGDIDHNTIYIRWDDGDPDTEELTVVAHYEHELYASTYRWIQSVAQSTEYHLAAWDGSSATDPSVSKPTYLYIDSILSTEGTVGSLAAATTSGTAPEWDYGNNDSLGYNTIYMYSATDPNGAVGTGRLDGTAPTRVSSGSSLSGDEYYIIDGVNNNTNATILGDLSSTFSGAAPTFYYNHNPFMSDYKYNIQGYTSGVVYCAPSIKDNLFDEDISGPFYAGLKQGSWAYGGEVVTDSNFDGDGVNFARQPLFAANGSSYVQIFGSASAAGQDLPSVSYYAQSLAINQDNAWLKTRLYDAGGSITYDQNATISTETGLGGAKIAFNSIQKSGSRYIASGQVGVTGNAVHPCIVWSTDAYGLAWQYDVDSDNTWATSSSNQQDRADTDNQMISAAYAGTTVDRWVEVLWRPSDDRLTIRYTDDAGATDGCTWTNTSIDAGGATVTGDIYSKVQYIQGQFVVTLPTGVLYGDGAAFTTKTISGATAIKDIAYGLGLYVVIESDTSGAYCSTIAGTYTAFDLPVSYGGTTNFIYFDGKEQRFLCSNQLVLFVSENAIDWTVTDIGYYGDQGALKDPTNIDGDLYIMGSSLYDGGANYLRNLIISGRDYTYWDVTEFVPISDKYRASTFSVLDGYVVLIGTREREYDQKSYPVQGVVSAAFSPTPDGILKDFTFDLSSYGSLGDNGIVPGSLEITVTKTDDSTEVLKDNSFGNLVGAIDSTGSIDYSDGTGSIDSGILAPKTGTAFTFKYEYYVNSDGGWQHFPRRLRWSAPQTYNDFDGVGSGTGDVPGDGMFLDSRPVNGRIVIFETSRVSALVPRGVVDDPWDIDTIKDDFRIMSNPVVVDDSLYVISTDGLLYVSNGITVEEAKASFDITAFDDFTETKPVTLDYSRSLNSLIAYYFNAGAGSHPAYQISLANGTVSKIMLPEYSDSSSISEEPRYITAVSNSSDQSIIVSHHPATGDTDKIVSTKLNSGGGIIGKDNSEDYWFTLVETGEIYPAPEGQKVSLKHLIARTYSEATVGTNTDRPRMAVKYRSLEDTAWKTTGDTVGTATMTASALTGSGTAWSTTIATGTAAAGEVSFTLPCQGGQARLYKDSTLLTVTTDYTISGNDITLTTDLGTGEVLYAYWENYPEVKVAVGDFFESTEGFHRVTSITNATTIVVDHYLSTGSETVTHIPAVQIPDGDGETKLGINGLVEGVRLRLYLIPEYGASSAPSVVKLTGLTIGHIPMGRKILSATGS